MLRVKLMCEYTVCYPLWWETGGQISQGELPLSSNLNRRIRAWAENFNSRFDHEFGWPTEAEMKLHRTTGERLSKVIDLELPDEYSCYFKMWEQAFRTTG